MKKVAINACLGGFELSLLAQKMLLQLKGFKDVCFYKARGYRTLTTNAEYFKILDLNNEKDIFALCLKRDYGDRVFKGDINMNDYMWEIIDDIITNREDKDLVMVIESLGSQSNTDLSSLKIIKIPDGIEYAIDDNDGMESIIYKGLRGKMNFYEDSAGNIDLQYITKDELNKY